MEKGLDFESAVAIQRHLWAAEPQRTSCLRSTGHAGVFYVSFDCIGMSGAEATAHGLLARELNTSFRVTVNEDSTSPAIGMRALFGW
jgi:hypothetical protein